MREVLPIDVAVREGSPTGREDDEGEDGPSTPMLRAVRRGRLQ